MGNAINLSLRDLKDEDSDLGRKVKKDFRKSI